MIEMFRAPDQDIEIIGGFIIGMTGSLQHAIIEPYLRGHGFTNIDPNAWYSLQEVLDFFSDLYYAPNAMFNLVAIGMNGGRNSPLPPNITTYEKLLSTADEVIHSGYRNGKPGFIRTEQLGPRHFRLTQQSPYPADLYYGVWYGLGKRFLPKGSPLVIQRSEVDPVTTLFDIQWSAT